MKDAQKRIMQALRYMRALIETGKTPESAAKVSARAFGLNADALLDLYKGAY